ncbi:hypothetical protein CTAYLR_006660 [Chrysophaeum taylorii]|uniref:Succinate-semialdehyde dehydrogenase, mitochondrial n=1 Tax=Chrysophaeum taylorii TaxID=2483200 RepID=A0AAD7XLW1_9STRA|nr:hypothetical protein CTAYLR_006660 [Chrysophaeum taylorii]
MIRADYSEAQTVETVVSWRSVVLERFRVAPPAVIRPDSGLNMLQESARYLRLNVHEASEAPYRQRFTTLEADGDNWKPVMYVYVFRDATENAHRFVLERAEEPHRSRVRCERDRKPQARDITTWHPPRSSAPDSFWAYPERLPGTSEYAVDWTSAPDRYAITRATRPAAAWLRCFRFFAYPARKFHVLEREWPPGSPLTRGYRLVANHTCPTDPPWRCLFAFYAFATNVPCTNRYTVQAAADDDGYARIRVGMTPSHRDDWQHHRDDVFYAHDIPVPGAARFFVQYRMRDGSNAEWEQNRIAIDEAGGGLWVDKFAFYAFPAPFVQLDDAPPPPPAPVEEEEDVWPCEDVTSPIYDATGARTRIGRLAVMDGDWALKALESAVGAFDAGQGEWPQMSLAERAAAVEAYLAALVARRDEIVEVLVWEICKTSADAAKEFDRTVEFARDVLQALRTAKNEEFADWTVVDGVRARVRRGPVGVCLMLAPFNYPLNEMYAMMIPALLMGNVVVLKLPAIGALAHVLSIDAIRATLPKGVVNFVSGSGRVTLSPVMNTGRVDALGFIGGRRGADALIAAHPHPHRLRVFSQLEGKNMGIVLPDADLDNAVAEIVKGALSFNGQRCTAIKLIMVHEDVADPLTAKLADAIEALKRGLPWDEGVKITPLPETAKPAYLAEVVDDATTKGARIVNPTGADVAGGLFSPAVVADVDATMRLFHEEQFGPVVPIATFSTLDDVVAAAKASWSGQQAAIFTSDAGRAAPLVDALATIVGRVNFNMQCSRGPDVFPFSGRRSSAMGTMSSYEAIRAFSVETLVATRDAERDIASGLDVHSRFLANLQH